MLGVLAKADTDSRSNKQDRGAGDLGSEVIRRLCGVRSDGDPRPDSGARLLNKKRIGMRSACRAHSPKAWLIC